MFLQTMIGDYILNIEILNQDHSIIFLADTHSVDYSNSASTSNSSASQAPTFGSSTSQGADPKAAASSSSPISTTSTQDNLSNINTKNSNLNTSTNSDNSSNTQTPPVEGNQKSSSSKNESISRVATKAVDGTIMTAALSGGIKVAQSMPTLAGKAAAVLGGVGLGATAIIAKNIAGNVSEDLGKISNKLIPSGKEFSELAEKLFHLTGNNGLDLLNMIQNFQRLQILFIVIIAYNLLLLIINVDKVENYLLKWLSKPTPLRKALAKVIQFYIKTIKIVQKSSVLILIVLFVLLFISNLYAYYYLDFFIIHLDNIIDLYFRK